MRNAQSTTSSPDVIQVAHLHAGSRPPEAHADERDPRQAAAATNRNPVVTASLGARADPTAEAAGDQEADERQEDDDADT